MPFALVLTTRVVAPLTVATQPAQAAAHVCALIAEVRVLQPVATQVALAQPVPTVAVASAVAVAPVAAVVASVAVVDPAAEAVVLVLDNE